MATYLRSVHIGHSKWIPDTAGHIHHHIDLSVSYLVSVIYTRVKIRHSPYRLRKGLFSQNISFFIVFCSLLCLTPLLELMLKMSTLDNQTHIANMCILLSVFKCLQGTSSDYAAPSGCCLSPYGSSRMVSSFVPMRNDSHIPIWSPTKNSIVGIMRQHFPPWLKLIGI